MDYNHLYYFALPILKFIPVFWTVFFNFFFINNLKIIMEKAEFRQIIQKFNIISSSLIFGN